MTIYGLEIDLQDDLDRRRWQQATSDHVIWYWRELQSDPFHVDDAKTFLQAQQQVGGGRRLQNTTFPPGVKVTYRQEIDYELKDGKSEDVGEHVVLSEDPERLRRKEGRKEVRGG